MGVHELIIFAIGILVGTILKLLAGYFGRTYDGDLVIDEAENLMYISHLNTDPMELGDYSTLKVVRKNGDE